MNLLYFINFKLKCQSNFLIIETFLSFLDGPILTKYFRFPSLRVLAINCCKIFLLFLNYTLIFLNVIYYNFIFIQSLKQTEIFGLKKNKNKR